jgi:hypothetical protein
MKNISKYLCSTTEDFSISIVTTAEQMIANPEALEMLNNLMFDCEQTHGKVLKNPHTKEELKQVIDFNEEWAHRTFDGTQTVFLLTNTKPIGLVLVRINDLDKREALNVPESVGTFVYVGDAYIDENYRGSGLFGKLFDKITTMIANPKREYPLPIQYSISMTNAVIIENGEERNHAMNLSKYKPMWQKRFIDNQIKLRHQDLTTREQTGGEILPTTTSDLELSDLMQTSEKPNNFVRGVYLEGTSKNYEEMKEQRRPSGMPKSPKSTKWIETQLTR